MPTAAQLVSMGYEGYTGWGDAEANADFNATQGAGKIGGGGGGGGGSANDYMTGAINTIASSFKSVTPYETVNPFSFDAALVKQASTAEYSQYYDEMLKDYTSAAERNISRSVEDQQKTLDQLAAGKDYYTGVERRLLDKTINTTNKGYAGNGLFFSGAREKDVRLVNEAYNASTGNYETNYQYNVGQAKTLAQRTQENVNTAKSMYARDTERAKTTAIEQGVLQRKSEALQQYEAGRNAYYDNAYA